MQTLDYDYTVHHRQNAGDDALLVRFFIDAAKDDVASKEAGRPIYKDVEWIDIRIPGSKDNVVVRPARPGDRERFPRHYAAFKQRIGNAEKVVGTPLAMWPILTKAQVEELKFFNIHTVEQLVGCPDSTSMNFMGIQVLKQKARDYLAAAQSAAPLAALREEVDALKAQNTELIAELKKLRDADNRTVKGR